MIDKLLFSLPGIKRVLMVLAALSVLQGFLIVGQAWCLSSVLTNLWLGNGLAEQLLWLAGFLFFFVGGQITNTIQEQLVATYAYERADTLRQSLLNTLFCTGSETVQAQGTGTSTSLVLEGVEQVETYLRLVLPKMTRLVAVPIIVLIWVLVLDWVSAVVMIIVFPFIVLYMVILGYTARDRAAKQHKRFKLLSNHFVDSLRGIDTLKLFGRSKEHGASIYETSEEFRKATMKTLRSATLSSLVLDLFTTLSVAAVAILLGLRLLDGTLVLFPALTILILAPDYFKPIREFASDYHASLDGKNALTSILEMIDQPAKDTPAKGIGPHQPASWDADSKLSLSSVDYSYPQHKALENINLQVSGTLKIGVIGLSGAGKSTLLKLLGGFSRPEEGSICVENQGTSLTDLRGADWRQQVSYLPQDPYIFHRSLRENIAFYRPEATEAEVLEAIEIVGLQELVEDLPLGIDTLIGEGERALSGGQAQRIALARLCLDGCRKVLLFDEPTAHLDIETEWELKERMLPLMEDRLVFFGTHRLHWMQEMDWILVMEQGRIVEQGTLEELQSMEGSFVGLVSQMECERL